jgi:hypothetical protein
MGRERVDGNHEVELGNYGGERNETTVSEQRSVAEAGLIQAAPLVTQPAALQVPVLAIVSRQNGCEVLERDRAGGIPVAGGPDDADVGNRTQRIAGAYRAGGAVKLMPRKPEVPRGGGEIVKGEAEEVREFHQLQLNLPGGRRIRGHLAPWDYLINAGQAT